MEREILFKAKRVDNREWVEGDLIHGHPHHYPNATIVNDGCIYTEVDPSTVCQYTGLKDKNGERIFEGDILYDSFYKEEGTVIYHPGYYSMNGVLGVDQLDENGMKNFEITGNIHDNEKA